jgi:hypothetical protein
VPRAGELKDAAEAWDSGSAVHARLSGGGAEDLEHGVRVHRPIRGASL